MVLFDDVLSYIQEETDVSVYIDNDLGFNGEYLAELEYYSALGEDVTVSLLLKNKTAEEFISALEESLSNYREACEEDLELYVKERPRGTEGFTVRELTDDADWKVEFWTGFVNDLIAHFENEEIEE